MSSDNFRPHSITYGFGDRCAIGNIGEHDCSNAALPKFERRGKRSVKQFLKSSRLVAKALGVVGRNRIMDVHYLPNSFFEFENHSISYLSRTTILGPFDTSFGFHPTE